VENDSTVDTDSYHSWRNRTNQGWKQRRSKVRGCRDIVIDLKVVQPFLGDESEVIGNNKDDEDPDYYADNSSSDDSASDDEDGSDAEFYLDDQRLDDLPFRAYRHTFRTWSTELTRKAAFLQVSMVRHTPIPGARQHFSVSCAVWK
jgi:hypothetical protein